MIEKNFDTLTGKIFTKIEQEDEQLIFDTSTGEKYTLKHNQECCENVYIEDINGDLNDLVGTPILFAEKSVSSDNALSNDHDSFTWTFFKLSTIKGSVTIRFYGESNGYYSEDATLYKIEPPKEHQEKKNKQDKYEGIQIIYVGSGGIPC